MDSRNGSRDAALDPFTIPLISTPTDHAYDSLADLFLGEGELAPEPMLPSLSGAGPFRPPSSPPRSSGAVIQAPSPTPTPLQPHTPTPDIEALILGHLPVLASPWVLQYARHRAAEIGEPVALLRLNSGTASVEIVGAPGEPEPPSSTLNEAIERAKTISRRWLIRVDETNELALAEALAAESPATLTLLTGADDAAVAACYRTLKALAEAIVGASDDVPSLRVVVMGANADAAAAAGRKIRQAAAAFLGLPPELAQPVPRMVPARAVNLYRGQTDLSHESLLSLVRASIRVPRHSEAAPPPPSPSIPPASPSPHPENTTPLASFVPGLNPLSARSPIAPSVELATDAEGRLHLLARADSPDACPAAAADLTAAAAWAHAHARLLGAAEPSLRSAEAPPLHLLTPTPRAARALVGTNIRVHALANANGAWASVEL